MRNIFQAVSITYDEAVAGLFKSVAQSHHQRIKRHRCLLCSQVSSFYHGKMVAWWFQVSHREEESVSSCVCLFPKQKTFSRKPPEDFLPIPLARNGTILEQRYLPGCLPKEMGLPLPKTMARKRGVGNGTNQDLVKEKRSRKRTHDGVTTRGAYASPGWSVIVDSKLSQALRYLHDNLFHRPCQINQVQHWWFSTVTELNANFSI